jgi:hypothetical protein
MSGHGSEDERKGKGKKRLAQVKADHQEGPACVDMEDFKILGFGKLIISSLL